MIFNKQEHKSATLASRIAAIDEEIAAGAAALADLKSRWRAAILNGDDAARTVLEDEVAAAERKAAMQGERRNILVAEQDAALARDAREEFGRRHAVQEQANAKAGTSAQKALRRAWDIIASMLKELDDARLATDLLNKAAPVGFAHLPYPDDIARGWAAQPRLIVSDKVVEHWCFETTGNRVGDQDAVQGGLLPVGEGMRPQKCVKRRFQHVRFHPPEDAKYAAPVSADLRFPRWDGAGPLFDGAFVVPGQVGPALAAAEAKVTTKTSRPIREEFIPIDDTDANEAA
jgi:hypothetical protein